MREKLYRHMGKSGAISLTFGILFIVFGVISGIILIVNGAKLLVGRQALEEEY